jgi:catechol 2,3-dioxygenase-like lactoylglutathione lyase family enzyme
MIKNTRYVLAVKDLEKSARYYQEKLGFQTDWAEGGWHQLSRETFVVMLGECSDDLAAFETRNHSYFAYVQVESTDGLHRELVAKGVDIMYPLRSQPWGMREFGICTVDGHRIMFGEPIGPPQ